MKKIIIWIVIIIVVVGLGWLVGNNKTSVPDNKETVKIGVITAMTGSGAAYGEEMKKGIDLAVQEINKSTETPLEVIYEDYQWDPKLALPVYNALKLKGVKIFIPDGSQGVSILGPEIVKDGNISFVASSVTPKYKDGSPLTCRLALTAENYGPALADFIFNKLGKNKVDTLYVNNEQGVSIQKAFEESYKKLGGEIVIKENFLPDATDFRTQIAKIKADKEAEVVVVGNYAKSASQMFTQIKELELKKQLVAENWTANNPAITDKSIEEGLYFIDYKFSIDGGGNSQLTNGFINKFVSVYGAKPNLQAAQGYNLIKVIETALAGSSNNSPAEIAKSAIQIKDLEIVGGKVSLNSDCEAQRETAVRQVLNGAVTNVN
jgi:branched-chain amino acid transport system substrate-binding protein